MDSGFSDLSNFHKSFRRQYGVTPLQYRKRGSIGRERSSLYG